MHGEWQMGRSYWELIAGALAIIVLLGSEVGVAIAQETLKFAAFVGYITQWSSRLLTSSLNGS
jgi:hypothetical protein